MPKLTKRIVDALEPKASPYFTWCSDLPGFGVRVFPSGKRVYYADYRTKDGARKRMSIGPHGKLTTEEARKLALGTLVEAIKGDDPLGERVTRRKSLTVAELCDNYLKAAEKGLILGRGGRAKKASTLATDYGRVERHIKPLLGRKLVIDLKRADIAKFIRDVTAGKTATDERTDKKRGRAIVEGGAGTAARTSGLLGGILSFAVLEGIIDHNPASGVKRPAGNRKDRRLSPDEYRALGKAIAAAELETQQAISSIWLLALTGCRRNEVESLQWSEVDIAGEALRLADSKTGASVRPLSKRAIDVLQNVERVEECPYVFPAARKAEGYFGSLRSAVRRITAAAKLEGVTSHTLRHSFASVGDDLGFTEATIGAVIGHASHSITSRYIHKLDSALVATANTIAEEIFRQMSFSGEQGEQGERTSEALEI